MVIMDQHNLNQSYFREEVGGKSLVSLTMKGKRKLTLNHMRNLSRRIQISSFIDCLKNLVIRLTGLIF